MLEFSDLKELTRTEEIKDLRAPYIHCNEAQQKAVLVDIAKKTPSMPDTTIGIHLGFSVWFNLDLLSVTNSSYAIILDIDPKISLIYKKLQLCLEEADNPEEFINLFYKELTKDKRLLQFPEEHQLSMLKDELSKGYGFLASQDNFSRVKKMAMEGKIFWGQADLTKNNHITLIQNWCEKNKVGINTLYLSNIPEWILEYGTEAEKSALKSNINSLIKKNTLVIDAYYLRNEKNLLGPPQRITEGNIPVFVKNKEEIKKRQHLSSSAKKSILQNYNDHSPYQLPKMSDLSFLSMPLDIKSKKNKPDDSASLFDENKENISPNIPFTSLGSPLKLKIYTKKEKDPSLEEMYVDKMSLAPPPKITRTNVKHNKKLLSSLMNNDNENFLTNSLSSPKKTSTNGFGIFDKRPSPLNVSDSIKKNEHEIMNTSGDSPP